MSLAAGISSFTQGLFAGQDRRKERERMEADDAWRAEARDRQRKDWDYTDQKRTTDDAWEGESRGQQRKLWVRADEEFEANKPLVDAQRKAGLAEANWQVNHGDEVRGLGLEDAKLGVTGRKQELQFARNREGRAQQQHAASMASQARAARRERQLEEQLAVQKQQQKLLNGIAPLVQSDPKRFATEIAKAINDSPATGDVKVGVGYNKSTGKYHVRRMRDGKDVVPEMQVDGGDLLNNVLMVTSPNYGSLIAAQAIESAKQYDDTEEEREAWELDFTRELLKKQAEASTDEATGETVAGAADTNKDGRISPAEARAYAAMIGNSAFPSTKMVNPEDLADRGKPAQSAAGVSKAKPGAAPVAAPAGAVEMLRKNPALRDAFDAKYGAGAAASILGK